MTSGTSNPIHPFSAIPSSALEDEVKDRYGKGAQIVEDALCCPTNVHDPDLLEIIPNEILEVDYGCGDPSAWVREGETVVDLGSGSGKACYVCAQKVGAKGQVIGIDVNDDMLTLARKHQDTMAERMGYANVSFRKAKIQDLALDLDAAEAHLRLTPVSTMEEHDAFEAYCDELRRNEPVIADDTVDVIVSNCVLNLVRPEAKKKLFEEMHRVLRRGGRAVISDIVCDEDPTPTILADPKLWSGCISGAYREDAFLDAFAEAGFHGIEIVARAKQPWQVIDGIEFRSISVRAYKGKAGPCIERKQAVIYKGPWSHVKDDDGHVLRRGQRMAICDKTFKLYTDPHGPYAGQLVPIEPLEEVAVEDAVAFNCKGSAYRSPRETKGLNYRETVEGGKMSCSIDDDCC